MLITATSLQDAYLIEPERRNDERGFFARTWCKKEFEALGLDTTIAQCNISYNAKKGTLRGLHYQAQPHEEVKLVRCTAGAIYDVIVDLRPSSPTFKRWESFELSSANRLALYIPAGFAHWFQALADETEVFYQMSEFYHPESAHGLRFDDPAFGISWPLSEIVISEKDSIHPDFI